MKVSGGKRVSRYHQLSNAEKQAHARTAMREPAVVCSKCEVQTTVADLLRHADGCPGPREPHPLSRWVTWREVLRMGVSGATLSDWVRTRRLRVRTMQSPTERRGPGRPPKRVYLARDVVKLIERKRRIDSANRTKSTTTDKDK